MYDKDFPYAGFIQWHNNSPIPWNEICAQVVELFGLPGDRYVTNVGLVSMGFMFKNQEDFLLFKLKWSEYEL